MDEYEFMLQDRITKIQAINEQYDLEHNAYISFSGGKDSMVVSKLVDLALPNEYKQCLSIWKHVYDEYIRIGYRLKQYPHENGSQLTIDDL